MRLTAPEYAGTDVYHTLYLPTNWVEGGTYPVIVEFAPNLYGNFAGTVEDTHLGYYQSAGQDAIWVTMPTINYPANPGSVATTWWGNGNADDPTGQALCAAYTITNLVRILENYGGDPSSVFIIGFSRGAIAVGYIGLSTEEMADIWLGFLPHSHPDYGWFNGSAAASGRTDRVSGRASFITYGQSDSGGGNSREGVDALIARGYPVESYEIAGTDHTDEWITDAGTPVASSASYTGHPLVSDVRARMRDWIAETITNKPGTHSISGVVTDRSGRPVSGARLQSGPTHWTFSDTTGSYELAGLIDGARTLTVSHAELSLDPLTTNVVMAGMNLENVNFAATSEVISMPNYSVNISSPGFRFEVTTSAGVVLPAHPTSGLSFLGSAADGWERLSGDVNTTTWRVTNSVGQTALTRLVAGTHTLAFTVTLDNGRSGNISMRTACPGPAAYGLGDLGAYQSNANLATSQKTYSIQHNGHAYRWLSSFVVFPQQGAAGACFDRKAGSISIGPESYQMANNAANEQTFYFFVGSMEEIYAAWREVRIVNGYPGVAPKMDGVELGFETWDLLRWNTRASTCRAAIQDFLDHGYNIRWAVTGSGFWRDEGAGGTSGTTASFGDYNLDKYPDTHPPLPPDFGDWCATNGIRWMIGQRVNFVPEDGPHLAARPSQNGATLFDTSIGTEEGHANGYFLRDGSGNLVKLASTIFPSIACYLLDGNVPGAAAWFKELYDRWGVDGVKEDTMISTPDHTIYNAPMRAIAEGGDLVMARCGAYSSPGTLTRVNDTGGASSMTLRCPINYIQYAASGAPNVYSDTVGFGGMRNVTATLRHAWLLALTAGMAVSDTPWNRGWSASDQARLKKAIDFHYELGPYLHSCAVDSHTTGYPYTMTPLPIAYPDDTNTYNLASSGSRQFQWMIGPSLLAAPLLHGSYGTTSEMNIYLPAGTWIDIETGEIHTGPTTLTDFDMPLDKTPVFVGGKGVFVRRLSGALPLKAVVYRVATGGSSYTFTYPDGTSTSTIVNNNTGWNVANLQITDTTDGSPIAFDVDAATGAISFDLIAGHDYALSGGQGQSTSP